MRFILMHKLTDAMEKGLPPEPAEMQEIGAMMGAAAQAGVFVSGEGLRPSSERLHIAYKQGQRTVTNGPFSDAKELPAGFMLLRVHSREEALSWVDRFAAVVGDVQLFMGTVVEPWDLGFAPRPEAAPLRVLAMPQANAQTEGELPPDPSRRAGLAALMEEMTRAGVLEARGDLGSTKRGARIRFEGGKRTVTDGPFAESKELIAGYAIFELPSKEEAINWAARFAEVVKVNEIDVRQLRDE